MPDDRFIHRKAGHSRKVNLLTDLEFRVWTQFLLSADDFGVMRGTHHPLQNDNDHLANRPARVIQRCLDALVKAGLLRRFEHQGKPYVFQYDWQAWQKVAYPRATNQPAPPAEMLAECDAPTQKLFIQHPGGAGKKRTEHSENVPEKFSEDSPLTRASAPAKRLTANGERLSANGFRADEALKHLQEAYPSQRVTSGYRTETAFIAELNTCDTLPNGYAQMRANLENHKRSHEWRVKGMIPNLEKWLREGLWKQQHEEAPTATLVSDRTARTLTSAAHFAKGGS